MTWLRRYLKIYLRKGYKDINMEKEELIKNIKEKLEENQEEKNEEDIEETYNLDEIAVNWFDKYGNKEEQKC